jgi:hypothetical protein
MGAAIENIALEASQHGIRCDVEYAEHPFAQVGELEPVATLRLSSPCEPDRLAGFIDERTTNRRRFAMAPLTPQESNDLSSVINDPGCEVVWLTSRGELRQLARLVNTADRIRFEYEPFHDELHRMLRFPGAQSPAIVDGLEPACLEIPRPAWPLLRWLRPWRRMNILNRLGLSHVFAATSTLQIVCSGAAGLLLTDRRDAVGALRAGRAMQRIWLAATEQQLAFQPVGALPLFLRRLEVFGASAFLPHHARRLARAREGFMRLFPQASDRHPAILFRVGRCGPPSARSGRYPPENIEIA